jgi:4-diphosphocytidyl-2-C-methyl-D-erythritol kinase
VDSVWHVTVRVRVPGKVNLHLAVGDLRPDGYHELVTVFHAVDLYDEIVATPSSGISIAITGEGAGGLPVDRHNLAWRAAELLSAETGVNPNVHLEIHKTIPVAGGMAGGSADAAGALLACARLWQVEAELSALAARIGSDVAFALLGGTAVGTGRGEVLRPVPIATTLHWVFALADGGFSTATAYAELDRHRAALAAPEPAGPPDALLTALAAGNVKAVGACLANDLQAAAIALRPELHRTLDTGLAAGALAGVVSGSGPTCAFLCPDADTAEHVAALLATEGVCRAVRVASGPASGAEVVAS